MVNTVPPAEESVGDEENKEDEQEERWKGSVGFDATTSPGAANEDLERVAENKPATSEEEEKDEARRVR
jgi:hypothetical protein